MSTTTESLDHVGIVACSAEGAALCFASICQQAGEILGPSRHPRITLDSISLADWMPAFERGDYRAVADIVLRSADLLATAGADVLVCPDNSAHRAWEFFADASPVPFIHIAEVVGREAVAQDSRRLGLLGTRFTMDGPVYTDVVTPMGIEIVTPNEADKDTIDSIIFDELIHGIITDESRRRYQDVIIRLAADDCDAVALSCTEIPLLITPEDSALPALDSTRLLAGAALRRAMASS